MFKLISKNKGFTLIEAVIYITLFALIFFFVIAVLIQITEAFVEAQRFRSITSSATISMERITREIRDADSVVLLESELDVDPGTLKVTNSNESGLITETTFYLTASSTLVMSQATSTEAEGGEGGGGGHHHDICTINSDCSDEYPVCCTIESHGPVPLCEDPSHHNGECGIGVPGPSETLPLTPYTVEVTSLVFRHVLGTETEAVRIEMTLETREGARTISEDFYSSVVLRGSY